MSELLYDCPNCARQSSVASSLVGQNLVCPHCQQQFFATPPAAPTEEKVPFFKFSRRKMLNDQLSSLIADGEYSPQDNDVLLARASKLGLDDADLTKLRRAAVEKAFDPIKQRMYETAHLSDEDMESLRQLGAKYGASIELDPLFKSCREIYLMEEKGELPLQPIDCALMTDGREEVFYAIATDWAQLRSRTKAYAGASISIPTGIKGVRFRIGQTTPIRSEELTRLATGTLYVTTKRLVFNGDRRNTTITFGRLLGTSVFRDAIEIEKSTGRSDYFFMDAIRARYISALVRVLKR